MAVYKVPQDVEADDKLLGPFSFRQFIYLIIVAMAIGIGYVLSKIFIGLAILVLPVVIFFGALALPLKKDQPMETYLAALISFYFLKPRKRLWQPDGLNSLVEITAPKQLEPERAKDISEQEAKERLSYLSDIVESDGWAVRGVGVSTQGVADFQQAGQQASTDIDLLSDENQSAQRFDQMLDARDAQDMNTVRTSFQQQMAGPPPQAIPQLQQNPYPPIHQAVVQPVAQYDAQDSPAHAVTQNTPTTTSVNTPSPAIIELANDSNDLSVATVDKIAHRIEEKQHGLPDDEVEISLH